MTQKSLLELAKQGDPNAIAALINHNLNGKGIKARVSRKDDSLKILLKGDQPLPKESLTSFVENGIKKLGVTCITTIYILGYQTDNEKPTWQKKIALTPTQISKASQSDKVSDSTINIGASSPKRGGCLDSIVLITFSIFGLPLGIFLSGIFGEDTSEILRVTLGIIGLSVPIVVILILRQHHHWNKIRLVILFASITSLIVFLAYLRQSIEYQSQHNQGKDESTIVNEPQQSNESISQVSRISQKAAQLRMDMSYQEVFALLGRVPDTVVNDQIRQELGEPIQGHTLITFEWKNDNLNCQPVSVDFDSSKMTATGWNEGRVCTGPSIFNEPFGKSCSETALCKVR